MNDDNIIRLNSSNSEEITLAEASEILGIPYATARRRIFENDIGVYNYGGVYRVVKADLLKYKESCYRKGSK
ncbi:MAG: helix-turn-helix domain-containing protein [Cyanobacteria bacterium RUI128]|nr:helix-turn-helix domain-containing protein [Cyanobacteria bacterium RUI128]